MNLMLLFFLLYSIVMKIFPPKKPNYLYGYQLGNAKKSVEHWKIANSYASNCMIVIYTLTLGLSFILDYQNYDGGILILVLVVVGLITTYVAIEKRLKRIDDVTWGNNGV
jgi:uncharacterized membrane protein